MSNTIYRETIFQAISFHVSICGMITVTIKEVAEKRGVTSSYQLMKLLDVPPSQASKWFKNDLQSINVTTLDRLCAALKCKPNDLLKYEPDAE